MHEKSRNIELLPDRRVMHNRRDEEGNVDSEQRWTVTGLCINLDRQCVRETEIYLNLATRENREQMLCCIPFEPKTSACQVAVSNLKHQITDYM